MATTGGPPANFLPGGLFRPRAAVVAHFFCRRWLRASHAGRGAMVPPLSFYLPAGASKQQGCAASRRHRPREATPGQRIPGRSFWARRNPAPSRALRRSEGRTVKAVGVRVVRSGRGVP
jgi:hypothetical protein